MHPYTTQLLALDRIAALHREADARRLASMARRGHARWGGGLIQRVHVPEHLVRVRQAAATAD
jgi:hypothetical protein